MKTWNDRILDVLVIDDSAVVRQVIAALLTEAGMNVSVASDPIIAMGKMNHARPDVIILDLQMPRMDGLTFLRKLMAEDPIPVVVCSGQARKGTEVALKALAEGAVEIISKPEVGLASFLEESAEMLVQTVRGAARARPRASGDVISSDAGSRPLLRIPAHREQPSMAESIVAMGASIGGTQALREVLAAMPSDSPAILIVQHMPQGYTATFARQLNSECKIEVREAQDGDRVVPGRALIAPGNRHMALRRGVSGYFVEVADGPRVSLHRPSVSVLFASVAQTAGRNSIGVIMTGMGSDGADGLLAMKQAGATTIAQDEPSCVVFGMPKAAIACGAVQKVAPLHQISEIILNQGAVAERRRQRPSI